MHKAVSRALWGAFFVGGLTVLGAGAAHAADTSGEDGAASGNQVGIVGELPVTIGGNAISILGDSESSGSTAAASGGDSTANSSTTSGEDAIAGGNQVVPEVVAPIIASGNSVSVVGDSSTEGTHTSAATADDNDGTTASTTGEDALAGGNQVMPDADLPIIVGGNSISLVGDSSTEGTHTSAATASDSDGTAASTTGEDALAGGNQVTPDANLPITVGGNSISLIGDSSTEGTHTSAATEGNSDGSATTSGEDSIAGGNQVAPDIDAPITVTGNNVSVIRDESLLDDGLFDDGLLNYGLLGDGFDTGLLEDGLLDSGIVDNRLLDSGLVKGPVLRIGIVDELLLSDSVLGENVSSAPVVARVMPAMSPRLLRGPAFGEIEASVVAPFQADATVGDDNTGTVSTDGTVGTDGTASALTPLVATAALSPAMMLAVTGVEALPLIGGIALLLGTGFGLTAIKRMDRAIG